MSAVALGLLLAGCQGGQSSPLAPMTYLNHALLLMQEKAVAGPRVDWAVVDRKAREMAAAAMTARQTYPAIEYALSQLQHAGDGHAAFVDPTVVKLGGRKTELPHAHPLPTVAVNRRIGEVTSRASKFRSPQQWRGAI
jgi:hypothetical protein